MYIGEGEALVRETFRRARLTAPSIVLLDEVDSIAGLYFPLLLHDSVSRYSLHDRTSAWFSSCKHSRRSSRPL